MNKENTTKSLGFSPELEEEHRQPDDWEFGASAEVPRGLAENLSYKERYEYLPIGEIQHDGDDKMDCVSRGINNEEESKMNYLYRNNLLDPANKKWLEDNGYVVTGKDGKKYIELSDAFLAYISGTTRNGNSIKAPLDARRKFGAVPKSKLPQQPNSTWEQYYNQERFTEEIYNLGREYNRRFPMNYERVYLSDIKRLYERDTMIHAGYAWPNPVNGEYPRVNNQANHVFKGIQPQTYIFDNYIDKVDKDWIKKLAENYKLYPYGYRVILNEVAVEPPKSNNNEDMIKTIKFATEPKIYLVDNNDHLKITWLGGLEGENTWNWFKEAGWVSGDFEVVDDSLKPLYKIEGGIVKVSYEKDSLQGGVQGFLQRLFNKLKK